jgi:hypothetical protein
MCLQRAGALSGAPTPLRSPLTGTWRPCGLKCMASGRSLRSLYRSADCVGRSAFFFPFRTSRGLCAVRIEQSARWVFFSARVVIRKRKLAAARCKAHTRVRRRTSSGRCKRGSRGSGGRGCAVRRRRAQIGLPRRITWPKSAQAMGSTRNPSESTVMCLLWRGGYSARSIRIRWRARGSWHRHSSVKESTRSQSGSRGRCLL